MTIMAKKEHNYKQNSQAFCSVNCDLWLRLTTIHKCQGEIEEPQQMSVPDAVISRL